MRKLIASTFTSLDGVMQAPGGTTEDPTGNFTLGGWLFAFWDAGMDLSASGFDGKDRELVLGRKTYEIFEAYWPYQPEDDPIARMLNAAKKHVASRTLKSLQWNNSSVLAGDIVSAITALKVQPGRDLQIIGSGNLIQTLQAASLIDEYNIWAFPVVLGRGKRLFENGARPCALRLVASKVSTTGVVMSTYVPAGDIPLGSLRGCATSTKRYGQKGMERKSYPTDVTDAQWALIEPLIPPAKPGGRPRIADMREVINALFYLSRAGCAWRLLPHDFPPWSTVHEYYWRWRRDGTWEHIHDTLRETVRIEVGREPEPSAAILDSQTVKTAEKGGVRGYDAGKKVNGRKRHILVDTLGLLLVVLVHPAHWQDRDAARLVLAMARRRFQRLRLIWADAGYAGQLVKWVASSLSWVLEIVKRPAKAAGFVLLPRRWVVERSFAWLGRYRRL